ncbi:MAG: DUF721 domain-containing protein [Beijerinckiaceae bacterium]
MTVPRRKKGPRLLADFTREALSPAAAKLGFGESDIVLHWAAIAGERLSLVSEPEKLQWPVRPKNAPTGAGADPAVLVLRAEGAFAIEIQHLAPVLIERINTRLGWRCVGRIVIRQGPVRRRPAGRGKVPPPPQDLLEAAGEHTTGIEAGDLRAALNRLGARVLTEHPASDEASPVSGSRVSVSTGSGSPGSE